MIPNVLKELVLIDMGLDWSQIDILSPVFVNIEELFLVNNKCSKISSEYTINKENFRSLTSLNLENNGIESWKELEGFRMLKEFNKLILNKNKIPSIWTNPGWPNLCYLSIEDNLISDWKTFNELNQFGSDGSGVKG